MKEVRKLSHAYAQLTSSRQGKTRMRGVQVESNYKDLFEEINKWEEVEHPLPVRTLAAAEDQQPLNQVLTSFEAFFVRENFGIDESENPLLPTYSQLLYAYLLTRNILLQDRTKIRKNMTEQAMEQQKKKILKSIDGEIATHFTLDRYEYYKAEIINFVKSKKVHHRAESHILKKSEIADDFAGWLKSNFGKDAELCDEAGKPLNLYVPAKAFVKGGETARDKLNKGRAGRYLALNILEAIDREIRSKGGKIIRLQSGMQLEQSEAEEIETYFLRDKRLFVRDATNKIRTLAVGLCYALHPDFRDFYGAYIYYAAEMEMEYVDEFAGQTGFIEVRTERDKGFRYQL